MFRHHVLIIAMLLPFTFLGCKGEVSSSTSECTSDDTCASGWECVNKTCVEKATSDPDGGGADTGNPNNKSDMGVTPQPDMGTTPNPTPEKPYSYHTFSVGSGKMNGGGYKAKVRITSSPAGKQTGNAQQHKVGAPK